MRRVLTMAAIGLLLSAVAAWPPGTAGATRRELDQQGKPVVIQEGVAYSGTFPRITRSGQQPHDPTTPDECGALPTITSPATVGLSYCDTIPIKILVPKAAEDGGSFLVKISVKWQQFQGPPVSIDDPTMIVNLWDNKQIKARLARDPGEDGWDPFANVNPYTLVKGALEDRPNKQYKISIEDPTEVDYNLVVFLRVGSNGPLGVNGMLNPYIVEASMEIDQPPELPFELIDDDNVLSFFDGPFTPVAENLAPVAERLDDLTGGTATAPSSGRRGPRVLSETTTVTPLGSDDSVTLDALDASIDPLLRSIKESNLADELAAPPLQVAAAEVKVPTVPAGATVLLSILVTPVLGSLVLGGYLLRRRAAMRIP